MTVEGLYLSDETGWRRFRYRKPTIIAAAVAGAVVVSGAAVSAATLGPDQDGSNSNAAVKAGTPDRFNNQRADRTAYNANSTWGPSQISVDKRLQHQVISKAAAKKLSDLKKKQARERARERARAAAKKRAAERAKAIAKQRAKERAASRSSSRSSSPGDSGPSVSAPSGSPKAIAKQLLASRGWSDQFGCLDSLWTKESGWRVSAANPSGAYGIPQALPGSKMSSAGPDWQSNAATQIKWGLGYIKDRYGSPCSAWSHSQANNWY
jgi:hypothetical protein